MDRIKLIQLIGELLVVSDNIGKLTNSEVKKQLEKVIEKLKQFSKEVE